MNTNNLPPIRFIYFHCDKTPRVVTAARQIIKVNEDKTKGVVRVALSTNAVTRKKVHLGDKNPDSVLDTTHWNVLPYIGQKNGVKWYGDRFHKSTARAISSGRIKKNIDTIDIPVDLTKPVVRQICDYILDNHRDIPNITKPILYAIWSSCQMYSVPEKFRY